MFKYIIILSVLAFFAVDNMAFAKDDLVEMQKKEAKRRKKIKKSVLKITDYNINSLSNKSQKKVGRLSGSVSLKSNATIINNSEEENDRSGRGKEYWKSEKLRLESSIRFYEKREKDLMLNLNKLSSDYLIVDFPPAKNRIKLDMEKTRAEINKVKKKIPFLKKQLEVLLENARKAGIPPGWLR